MAGKPHVLIKSGCFVQPLQIHFSSEFSASHFSFSVTIITKFQYNTRCSEALLGAFAKKNFELQLYTCSRLSARPHVSQPSPPDEILCDSLFRIFIKIYQQMPILFLLGNKLRKFKFLYREL